MSQNTEETAATTPTGEELLQRMNEAVAALQQAEQTVVSGTARLATHENDPDAHQEAIAQAVDDAIEEKINNGEIASGSGSGGSGSGSSGSAASTSEPGLVQLSSAVNSDSESMAATPKAIKTVNDALTAATARVSSLEANYSNIALGDLSPVIGVALVQEGSGSGLWCNVNAEGGIVTPPKRYFDFHPIWSALTDRVLVDGQVMQRHKKFYYKTAVLESGELAGKHVRFISPEQLDGFAPHPAFMKDGVEIDKWYCGTYSATDDGGSPKLLGSKPGRAPFVNVNFSTMQGYCRNRNVVGVDGFDMWNIWQVSELQLLFLIEHASPDSQGIIGRGRVDTSAAANVDADDVAKATYRGHVGLWGNVWEMVAGIEITTAGKVRLWNMDGSKVFVDTDFTLPAYNGSSYQWIVSTKRGQGTGYDFDLMFLPEVQNGTLSNATYPDGFWGRNGSAGNVMYLGGAWGNGSAAGLFCQNMNNPASGAYTSIGCRLAKA